VRVLDVYIIISMCVYASAVKKKIEVESDVFLNMLSHHVVGIYSTTILYMYYIIIISSISTYIRVCIYFMCVRACVCDTGREKTRSE